MRSLKVLTALTMPLLVFIACASGSEPPVEIRVDGSPGVRPLVQALADEYARVTGDSLAVGSGLGSSQRAAAVADSVIDIAMASHGIDTTELAERGLAVHEIARSAVVFAVNADVGISKLTRAQVCDLLAGRITNWNRVGGRNAPIAAFTRPPDEVDAEIAREHVECLGSITQGASVQVVERPDSMAALLARTPGAFGITSLILVEGSGGRIRPLDLDDISPTPENVRSNRYPLVRRSFLMTRARPSQPVARFLEFVGDSAGRRVITANGAVPPDD